LKLLYWPSLANELEKNQLEECQPCATQIIGNNSRISSNSPSRCQISIITTNLPSLSDSPSILLQLSLAPSGVNSELKYPLGDANRILVILPPAIGIACPVTGHSLCSNNNVPFATCSVLRFAFIHCSNPVVPRLPINHRRIRPLHQDIRLYTQQLPRRSRLARRAEQAREAAAYELGNAGGACHPSAHADPVKIIRPYFCAAICGHAARLICNTPRKFTSSSASNPGPGSFSTPVGSPTVPAWCRIISMRPKRSSV
ncbi:hypothetical protein K432DRAFT_455645, partial [Lepidopterella palustris CBS 459.81]